MDIILLYLTFFIKNYNTFLEGVQLSYDANLCGVVCTTYMHVRHDTCIDFSTNICTCQSPVKCNLPYTMKVLRHKIFMHGFRTFACPRNFLFKMALFKYGFKRKYERFHKHFSWRFSCTTCETFLPRNFHGSYTISKQSIAFIFVACDAWPCDVHDNAAVWMEIKTEKYHDCHSVNSSILN